MPAPKSHNQRRALADELLGIFRKHDADFKRVEDIKRELRSIATDAGENFKEEFAGKGAVKVSGGKPAQFKGILPQVDAPAFLALSERRRQTMIESGVVRMVEEYGKPYYGAVSVDLF